MRSLRRSGAHAGALARIDLAKIARDSSRSGARADALAHNDQPGRRRACGVQESECGGKIRLPRRPDDRTWGHEGIMNSATQRSPWEIASPDAGSERFFATGGAVLKSDATRSGGRPFPGRPPLSLQQIYPRRRGFPPAYINWVPLIFSPKRYPKNCAARRQSIIRSRKISK